MNISDEIFVAKRSSQRYLNDVYPLITGGERFHRQNNLYSLLFFSMSLFPSLAIGVAVLRHRLWDIDLIYPPDSGVLDPDGDLNFD